MLWHWFRAVGDTTKTAEVEFIKDIGDGQSAQEMSPKWKTHLFHAFLSSRHGYGVTGLQITKRLPRAKAPKKCVYAADMVKQQKHQ